jgi:hypothetical protein
MLSKIEWMLHEVLCDGFDALPLDIVAILQGNFEFYDPALVDYVLELEKEWSPEGQE